MAPSQRSAAHITYYALDLEKRELERTLDQLAASPVGPEIQGKIDTHGLWGTFEGGLKFVEEGGLRGRGVVPAAAARARSLSSDDTATQLSSPTTSEQGATETPLSTPDMETLETPLYILFLGSTLGNFPRDEQVPFLRSLPLRAGKGDTLLLGLDQASDARKIELAYNDPAGTTRRFILNGLKNAGLALGNESLFAPEKWEYFARYDVQERKLALLGLVSVTVAEALPLSILGRHDAFYRSRAAQTVRDPGSQVEFAFLADELVHIEESHKVVSINLYLAKQTDNYTWCSTPLAMRIAFSRKLTCAH